MLALLYPQRWTANLVYLIGPPYCVIGQARKEITVHSRPLASLSSTLDKLINSAMLEAKRRQTDWSGVVKEDTFVRLCEYAYLRDYMPPSCSEREVVPY
ncbi:uncharacterized protein BDW43DRAFT_317019 [Aspergillus alliaceus]|uniref:uncharacterized protein n=1 Tax=Petromyces alliaceus TaxID=209559 RepID=UPI0012A5066B|nr:uncharacterized protein BDW43DRAFT_317019 [Aspergillus alliaceus]KAB8227224.1 hypothetical protein BDW43DRAFT_317019 [Aspergillus alliaceus]